MNSIKVTIKGLDEYKKNMNLYYKKMRKAARDALDYSLEDTANYIKDEYVWNTNHKGFNDVTGNLRNALHHELEENPHLIRGMLVDMMNYAATVEYKAEGRHAFMYPGIKDKEDEIFNTIKETVIEVLGKRLFQ